MTYENNFKLKWRSRAKNLALLRRGLTTCTDTSRKASRSARSLLTALCLVLLSACTAQPPETPLPETRAVDLIPKELLEKCVLEKAKLSHVTDKTMAELAIKIGNAYVGCAHKHNTLVQILEEL